MQTLREALRIFIESADSFAKRRFLLALVLVALGSLLAASTPAVLKLVVDALHPASSAAAVLPAPVQLIVLYVLGQFLWRCSTELRMLLHRQAEQRVRRHVSRHLFHHLVKLPMKFHLERRVGSMGETAEQGIRGYELLLEHLVLTVLPVTVELSLVAFILIHLHQETYLLILGAAAVAYALTFYRASLAVRRSAESVSSSHIHVHSLLSDSLINQEAIKCFDASSVVCHRYDSALSDAESAWSRFFRTRAVNGLAIASIFGISLCSALLLAASDVASGRMTLGDFVLVNAYLIRLVQPLEMVGFAIRDIAQGIAFLGSMLALFGLRTETEDSKTDPCASPSKGELSFEGVSFSYRDGQPVLRDVSFHVPAGRTIAVVGASGSGKSSLIRLLFRLYELDQGRILLDGIPITNIPLSSVRRATALVPQDTVLFHDTIAMNIAFGRFGASHHEIEEAARIANLHDFISSLPEGYETLVGERGLKLSGGERQRVAIARAALRRPRVYVFDEATSSLDSRTEGEILANLRDLSRNCTTLIVAHRLSTVVHADQILVLHRGVVVERGTHRELRALQGHYAALWNAQHGTREIERMTASTT